MKGERKLKQTQLLPGTHLVDADFHNVGGITRFSLQFWDRIKHRINVTHAKMTHNSRDWFRLYLLTDNDVIIEFTGCSSGYHGEGPRGAYQILTEAGFSKEEAEIVFKIGVEEFYMAKEKKEDVRTRECI